MVYRGGGGVWVVLPPPPKYIHPQELATYLLSYFMGCIAVVGCVLVLRCGLAGVVWYPDACCHNTQLVQRN